MCVRDGRGRKAAVSMGKATKTCLSTCQKVWSCRFVWQAWHCVTFDAFQPECVCVCACVRVCMCACVCARVCACPCATVVAEKLPCLWGKPPKHVFLDVLEDVLMPFCVAGVAVFDIRRVSAGMCVRDRRGRKVAASVGKANKTCLSRRVRNVRRSCRFVWQAWHCVTFDVFQPECVCVCVCDRRGKKVAVSMGKATKTCLSRRVRRCGHVVLHGRRGCF